LIRSSMVTYGISADADAQLWQGIKTLAVSLLCARPAAAVYGICRNRLALVHVLIS
jgi:hypothetical protein